MIFSRRIRRGFTLVEVMIVVLVIAVILMIAVPNFITARARARQRTCVANLRAIDGAKEFYANEKNLPNGTAVNQPDIWPEYLRGPFPTCPEGGLYSIAVIGNPPECSRNTGDFPHVLGY